MAQDQYMKSVSMNSDGTINDLSEMDQELGSILNNVLTRKFSLQESGYRRNINQATYVLTLLCNHLKIIDKEFKGYVEDVTIKHNVLDYLEILSDEEFNFHFMLKADHLAFQPVQLDPNHPLFSYKATNRTRLSIGWTRLLTNDVLDVLKVHHWLDGKVKAAINHLLDQEGGRLRVGECHVTDKCPITTISIHGIDSVIKINISFGVTCRGWPPVTWRPEHWASLTEEGTDGARLAAEINRNIMIGKVHVWRLVATDERAPPSVNDKNTLVWSFKMDLKPLEAKLLRSQSDIDNVYDKDGGCRQQVVRLLMHLQEKQNWPSISANTWQKMVLHACELQSNFSIAYLGWLFRTVLTAFHEALEKTSFKHPLCEYIELLNDQVCCDSDVVDTVRNIVNDATQDPGNISSYFEKIEWNTQL